ncbi:MAG TPA: hypothetical protein VNI36_00525 [Candidatus Dormibacteraeota bacterium]|nr:hypothetical protein [Candidatus Dormibacteraeota bacterium]
MIAILIFAISFFTLLQFFVSYCQAVIAESRCHEVSENTREICGLTAKAMRGDQFKRLLQLIGLCPEPGGDANKIRAMAAYFEMLGLANRLFRLAAPWSARWIEQERDGCSHVVAVALDRRIANNRMLMAQHAAHSH